MKNKNITGTTISNISSIIAIIICIVAIIIEFISRSGEYLIWIALLLLNLNNCYLNSKK